VALAVVVGEGDSAAVRGVELGVGESEGEGDGATVWVGEEEAAVGSCCGEAHPRGSKAGRISSKPSIDFLNISYRMWQQMSVT
jgi:hypothetical protein